VKTSVFVGGLEAAFAILLNPPDLCKSYLKPYNVHPFARCDRAN